MSSSGRGHFLPEEDNGGHFLPEEDKRGHFLQGEDITLNGEDNIENNPELLKLVI